MQIFRSVLFAVLLLGLAAGCGGRPAVETPEKPARKPEGKPVPLSTSASANSAPAKSPQGPSAPKAAR
jgi:hypothetical protein